MTSLPQPGDQFGRYRIEAEFGRGAMGIVMTAHHLDLDRPAALKFVAPEFVDSAAVAARLQQEAKALARLDSPHVVQIYDAGEQDGWFYIATQLVPDGDLNQLIKDRGLLTPTYALEIIDQVLVGLGDAHEIGLLHRDVKPGNVLVRHDGDHTHAYLCDFGIARDLDGDPTLTSAQTRGVVGTWSYLSPERLDGAGATVRSDLYAVGCVLWFLVSGAAPYGGTFSQIAIGHHTGPIPQLHGSDHATESVNRLLRRSLAKDDSTRYPSAAAMRQDLNGLAHLPDAPVEHPASKDQTAIRRPLLPEATPSTSTSRRRTSIVIACALVALTLAALAVTQWPDNRASANPTDPDEAPDRGQTSTKAGSGTEAQLPFQCWDGSFAEGPKQCLLPSGRTGMAWIFPDSRGPHCTKARHSLRSLSVWCRHPERPTVHYSEWYGRAPAIAHYGQPPGSVAARAFKGYQRWNIADHKVALLHPEAPFSVTISTPAKGDRNRALRQLRLRPVDQVQGTWIEQDGGADDE